MDLDKLFATDTNLEEEGVWVDIGDNAKIKIARLGNSKSKELFKAINRQQKIKKKYLEDTPEEEVIPVLAKAILLDWDGIKIKGEVLPYSYANAVKALTEYKDFRNLVLELSMEAETFRKQEIEDNKEELGKS